MVELLLMVCVIGATVIAMQGERRRRNAELRAEALLRERREMMAGWAHNERVVAVGMATAELVHELRAPLTTALMALQLHDRVEPERQAELRQELRASLDRMQALASTVGDLSRRESAAAADVSAAAEAALALVPRDQRDRVHVVLDEDLPHAGMCPLRLSQVLHNLIDNGLAVAGNVWVEGHVEGGAAQVTVHDDGPGVPRSAREIIFQPWRSGRAPGDGTGLGLSLVDRLLREAGGSVTVTDGQLGGAAFVLRVPLVASEHARAA